MANWSVADMYVGQLGIDADDLIFLFLNRANFAPSNDYFFSLQSIGVFGPAIHLHGMGRWYSPAPLAPDFKQWIDTGIVVQEMVLIEDAQIHRSIHIGGEQVFGKNYEYDFTCPVERSWSFEGRTKQERTFFNDLFVRLNPAKQTKLQRIAAAMDRVSKS